MKKVASPYWPVAVMILLLICGAASLYHSWADPIKAQALVSTGSLLAAIFLLCTAWLYIFTNQDTLSPLEKQWSESRQVHLSFGLIVKDERLAIWAANLGSAHSIILRERIRTPSGALEEFDGHMAVQAGKLELQIRRWVKLVRRADVMVGVDNGKIVNDLARAAAIRPTPVSVLVDVDVGVHRCGVPPG